MMSRIYGEGTTERLRVQIEKLMVSFQTHKPEKISAVEETTVEANFKGQWRKIPALNINGTTITVAGSWVKTAVVYDEEWLERELQDPETCIQRLKERSVNMLRADVFTFSQKLPATTPKYSYLTELESVAAVPITSFKDWWEKLPQVTRKNVRRSQKRGVEVSVKEFDDALIRDIVELTKDSPTRQGKRFLHYGKTFEQTKKDQSTHLDRSDFICAYSGNELIGLLKIVYSGSLASVLQFLPKASEQEKRPANALIAKAVEVCEAKGISYLIYGLFNYGNKRHDSLLEFKTRNGFEEFLVPRFYVPLTLRGVICLKFKLHRGIIGLLPDVIIRAAVGIRTKYHNLAGFQGRRSSIAEQPNRIRQTERSNPPAGSTQDSEV
jgi:hypothetical protein